MLINIDTNVAGSTLTQGTSLQAHLGENVHVSLASGYASVGCLDWIFLWPCLSGIILFRLIELRTPTIKGGGRHPSLSWALNYRESDLRPAFISLCSLTADAV